MLYLGIHQFNDHRQEAAAAAAAMSTLQQTVTKSNRRWR
jgi:hypothetical protein